MKLLYSILITIIVLTSIAGAATNSHTQTLTTTAELSSGAWNPDSIVSSDRINYINSLTQYRYVSPAFAFPNGTAGYPTMYSMDTYDEFDEGFLYSNSLWLNSTDYRQVTGGHAFYSWRFPCTVTASGGTYDAWYTDSSGQEKATYSGNTQVVNPASLSNINANYLAFDGTDDYATIPVPTGSFDFEGYWMCAFMINNTYSGTTTSHPVTFNNASAAYPTIQLRWIDSTTKYWAVYVQDSAGTSATYYSSSNLTTKNAYHYVVVKCDATNIMLYDNGVLKCKGPINVGAGHLKMTQAVLGGKLASGSLTNDFTGRLDEVRFMHGDLPVSWTGNTSGMASYMWNCTKGIENPLKSTYKISGSGTTMYQSIYAIPAATAFYTYDINYVHLNTRPTYTGVEPVTGANVSSPVGLYIDGIHDADSTYDNAVYADFYVDGVKKGTRDGTLGIDTSVSYDAISVTGGSHTWFATYYDQWGGTINTSVQTFNVTGRLYFRDEQSSSDVLNTVNVTVSFYSDDSSVTYTTSDGYIDLDGLPTENMLVTADAPGYVSRKTILESFYYDDNIYLISDDAEAIYNSFKINSQTLTYAPSEYRIRLYKPMADGIGLVFSSYFDFDGTCGTYLIASDAYKLVIVAPDDTEYELGWVYPDPDGVLEINLQSLEYTQYFDNWLHFNYSVNHDTRTMTLSYESDKNITNATCWIENANNDTVFNVTVTENDYVFQYIGAEDAQLRMHVSIEATDGSEWTSQYFATFIDDYLDIFPPTYPEWLKQMIIAVIVISVMLGFGPWRADVAAVAGVGIYSFAVYMEEIHVNSYVVALLTICALGAIVKHQRRKKRM